MQTQGSLPPQSPQAGFAYEEPSLPSMQTSPATGYVPGMQAPGYSQYASDPNAYAPTPSNTALAYSQVPPQSFAPGPQYVTDGCYAQDDGARTPPVYSGSRRIGSGIQQELGAPVNYSEEEVYRSAPPSSQQYPNMQAQGSFNPNFERSYPQGSMMPPPGPGSQYSQNYSYEPRQSQYGSGSRAPA